MSGTVIRIQRASQHLGCLHRRGATRDQCTVRFDLTLFQAFFLQVKQVADILIRIKRLASVGEPAFQLLAEATEQVFPVGAPALQRRCQFYIFFIHKFYYTPIFCSSRSTIRIMTGTVTVSYSLGEKSSVSAPAAAAGTAVRSAEESLYSPKKHIISIPHSRAE